MTTERHMATGAPAGFPVTARLVDGGDMECGSGLLLLITRAMRRLEDGELLAVRSSEPSVRVDLPAWAEMVGNDTAGLAGESAQGPWWFAVRKGSARVTLFSTGEGTPVGDRLCLALVALVALAQTRALSQPRRTTA